MMSLVTMFRTTPEPVLERFFRQAAALPADARLVLVEGDSADDTRARLHRHMLGWTLSHPRGGEVVVCDTGLPHFGSVLHADRLRGRAMCKNAGLDCVGDADAVVVLVESDLLWDAGTLLRLARHLENPEVDVVAPRVMAGAAFYDIWAFRTLREEHLGPFPPHAPGLSLRGLTEIGTAGSCLVMTGHVARSCRCDEAEEIVGLCRHARRLGYRVWTDWTEEIRHP